MTNGAATPAGPWDYIGEPQLPNTGAQLPNTTGSYEWRVPKNVPVRVYLRLTVRDAAGNVSVAQTNAPQLVDFARPEAKILGLVRKQP